MEELKVTFGDATLAPDQLITRDQAQEPLKFYWPKVAGHTYSVSMYDQDAVGANGKPYLHYQADSISEGNDGVVKHGPIPPNPPSGIHRYWVVVSDQASGVQVYKTSFRVVA